MPVGPYGEPLPYGNEQQQPQEDIVASARQFLDALHAFLRVDGLDEDERLDLEKVATTIQGIITGREKQTQDMLGGKLSPAMMQRAYQNG